MAVTQTVSLIDIRTLHASVFFVDTDLFSTFSALLPLVIFDGAFRNSTVLSFHQFMFPLSDDNADSICSLT